MVDVIADHQEFRKLFDKKELYYEWECSKCHCFNDSLFIEDDFENGQILAFTDDCENCGLEVMVRLPEPLEMEDYDEYLV